MKINKVVYEVYKLKRKKVSRDALYCEKMLTTVYVYMEIYWGFPESMIRTNQKPRRRCAAPAGQPYYVIR